MSEQLEQTAEIQIIRGIDTLLDEQQIISELSDEELDKVAGEAYSRALECYENDDAEMLHDSLHIWRIAMGEHHKRVDAKWNATRSK